VNAPTVPFPRELSVGVPPGQDIISIQRGLSRAGFWPWMPFKRYFTIALSKAVRRFQGAGGDGIYGPLTHEKMRRSHSHDHPDEWAFDATAIVLMNEAYLLQHPGIVSPCKTGQRPAFLHETGGIDGNWALDWMNPAGTAVYAPTAMTVVAKGGHDPASGTWRNGKHDRRGDIFGWSLHLRDRHDFTYFATHLGSVSVAVGQKLLVAQRFGAIGHWPHDPGRSHLHLGVDAGSDAASKKMIRSISLAPRP